MPTEPQIHERKTYTKPRKRLAARKAAYERLDIRYRAARKPPGSLKKK